MINSQLHFYIKLYIYIYIYILKYNLYKTNHNLLTGQFIFLYFKSFNLFIRI